MKNIYYLVGIIVIVFLGVRFLGVKPKEEKPVRIVSADIYNQENKSGEFLGEKGEKVNLTDNRLMIATDTFETNKIKYFNTELGGKTMYFMVVKDESGTYRAAANACEVCFGAHKGFRQEEDKMICNNCSNSFALNTLGVVKGGCNPGPISANLPLENGKLVISTDDLNQVSNLF